MRILVVMRGLPASGKSTLVSESGLADYALSPDRLRLMASSPVMGEDGRPHVSGDNDQLVWETMLALLERRMQHGDTTVIDATHTRAGSIGRYHDLCVRYGYDCYVVTCDVSAEECLWRNARRPSLDRVPDDVIERMTGQLAASRVPDWCHELAPKTHALRDLVATRYLRMDIPYRRVMVIGDVHGCHDALMAAVDGPRLDRDTLYVFAGDLFDRGVQNAELLGWLACHVNDPNVVLVEGNHDSHLRNYVRGTERRRKDGTIRRTTKFQEALDAFRASELCHAHGWPYVESVLGDIVSALVPCYPFSFDGTRYLVTHAGLAAMPKALGLVSADACIHGVGDYDTPIDELWSANDDQGVVQVHGHRLTRSTARSVCLESGVEFGKALSVLVIDHDGHRVERTSNPTYDHDLTPYTHAIRPAFEGPTGNPTTNAIMASPFVRAKREPTHDLVSLAFTRKAFSRNHWDSCTTKARGLFVDAVTGDVRLRSYDKFFAENERPETAPDAIGSLAYPLRAYVKENGFLGIMSVVDGDVVLATKGSTTGDYADRLHLLWNGVPEASRRRMADLAREHGCSFVFECLAMDDQHIIRHDAPRLVLLDAVRNSYAVGGTNVDPAFSQAVCALVDDGGTLAHKRLAATFDDRAALLAWEAANRRNRDIEGLVCVDGDGFVFKVKLPYYRLVKRLRGSLMAAQAAHAHGRQLPDAYAKPRDTPEVTALVERFMAYVMAYGNDVWPTVHVIDAVADFEADTGTDLTDWC